MNTLQDILNTIKNFNGGSTFDDYLKLFNYDGNIFEKTIKLMLLFDDSIDVLEGKIENSQTNFKPINKSRLCDYKINDGCKSGITDIICVKKPYDLENPNQLYYCVTCKCYNTNRKLTVNDFDVLEIKNTCEINKINYQIIICCLNKQIVRNLFNCNI